MSAVEGVNDHDHSHHHEHEIEYIASMFTGQPLNFRRPDELSDYHLMELMDRVGEQMHIRGHAIQRLTLARQLIYQAIDAMDQESWTSAYEIRVWKAGEHLPLRLWDVIIRYGNYPVREHRPGHPWEVLPSGGQLFYSLAMFIGAHRAPDIRF